LNAIKEKEMQTHRKKMANFDEEQVDLISDKIIQKITNHFANHLKDENTSVDESVDWIQRVFQL
jgi:glutamyl-tRNA reductase